MVDCYYFLLSQVLFFFSCKLCNCSKIYLSNISFLIKTTESSSKRHRKVLLCSLFLSKLISIVPSKSTLVKNDFKSNDTVMHSYVRCFLRTNSTNSLIFLITYSEWIKIILYQIICGGPNAWNYWMYWKIINSVIFRKYLYLRSSIKLVGAISTWTWT